MFGKKIIPDSTSRLSSRTAKKRLCVSLLIFFLCLAAPMTVLMQRVYDQFRVEMFYQYRESAEGLQFQLNEALTDFIKQEEKRPFVDYQFYKVSESPLLKQQEIALSPLARLDHEDALPGLVGYFQIEPDGTFNTPILPDVAPALLSKAEYGIEKDELQQRLARQRRIQSLLLAGNFLSVDKTGIDPNAEVVGEMETYSDSDEAGAAEPESTQEVPSYGALAQKRAPSPQKLSELALDDSYAKQKPQEKPTASRKRASMARPQRSIAPASDSSSGAIQKRAPRKENIVTSSKKSADIFLEQVQNRKNDPQAERYADSAPTSGASRMRASQGMAESASGVAREQSSIKSQSTEEMAASSANRKKHAQSREYKDASTVLSENITSVIGEIDPIQMQKIDSGHYVFYRRVWREEKRYLQGFIVTADNFLDKIIKPAFLRGNFDQGLRLIVGYEGTVAAQYRYQPLYRNRLTSFRSADSGDNAQNSSDKNILIYRNTLIEPFGRLEIVVLADSIPFGPGATVIHGLIVVIACIVLIGFVGLYRVGVRQINLAEERLNFVSSVSHELKTPLTSILMYSEMLREGLVSDEAKRGSYYDFIYFESERLSRLITNILQLAKLGRGRDTLTLTKMTPDELSDLARSKVSTLLDRTGFTLQLAPYSEALAGKSVLVDPDAFCQIVINLVDNAVKFSAKTDKNEIALGFKTSTGRSDELCFYVRDYGQGVPKSQSKKIFELFYRVGSELTRTTPGTGIGLSLVNALARAMGGRVDLVNRDPGAEFRVFFPISGKQKHD